MIEERVFRGGQYAAEVEPPEAYRARRESGALAPGVGRRRGRARRHGCARATGTSGRSARSRGSSTSPGSSCRARCCCSRRSSETLLLPARRPALEAWTGPKFGPGRGGGARARVSSRSGTATPPRWSSMPGAGASRASSTGWPTRCRPAGRCGWRCPGSATRGAHAGAEDGAGLARPPAELRGPRPGAGGGRAATAQVEPGEIALMRKAVAATVAAMRAAAAHGAARAGREGEVEGAAFAALRAARRRGLVVPSDRRLGPGGVRPALRRQPRRARRRRARGRGHRRPPRVLLRRPHAHVPGQRRVHAAAAAALRGGAGRVRGGGSDAEAGLDDRRRPQGGVRGARGERRAGATAGGRWATSSSTGSGTSSAWRRTTPAARGPCWNPGWW